MHSYSRTWVSPRYKENGQRQALNHARRKLCPNSPFWTNNFDLAQHKKEWAESQARRAEAKKAEAKKSEEERKKLHGSPLPPLPKLTHPPFNNKQFTTNHSSVLLHETIFVPSWQRGKANIAPWPSRAEMKYEGDDRISTDRLHRRFPGAPRVEGNDTVNWQHRGIIAQWAFDDFYYPGPGAVEVFLRTHWVGELEFTEGEGREVLGEQLWGELEVGDVW